MAKAINLYLQCLIRKLQVLELKKKQKLETFLGSQRRGHR